MKKDQKCWRDQPLEADRGVLPWDRLLPFLEEEVLKKRCPIKTI